MRARLLFLSCLVCWPLLLAAEDPPKPVIRADNQVLGEDTFQFTGNVEADFEDYRMFADAVLYDVKKKEIAAEGRITMNSGTTVLSGEKMRFNLRTHTGDLWDAVGLMTPFLQFEAGRLRQLDRQTYAFRGLHLTSCAQVTPRWSIHAASGRIKKDRYVEMVGALFKVKQIPVFFWPYLRYPVNKDGRATGFLFPRFGNSTLRGKFLQTAFFWDIRPNLDLTLNVDLYSKMGTGTGAAFRYLFPTAQGSVRFLAVNYRHDFADNPHQDDLGGFTKYSDWALNAEHTQSFKLLQSKLTVSVDRTSTPLFLRLLDTTFDRQLNARYQTSANWSGSVLGGTLSVRVAREETFYRFNLKDSVLEKLPIINYTWSQKKILGLPGYFSLRAEFQHAVRSGTSFLDEPVYSTGIASDRLVLTPGYNLSVFRLPWLEWSAALEAKNSWYGQSLDPVTLQPGKENLLLLYGKATTTLTGPVLARTFGVGRWRFRHVIEPEFEAGYATKTDHLDRLIKIDFSDFSPYSYVQGTLNSRLFVKPAEGGGTPRELATLNLSQQYYFDPALANLSRKVDGIYMTFSELSSSLRVRLQDSFALDLSTSYNHYRHNFSRITAGVDVGRDQDPVHAVVRLSSIRSPFQPATYVFNRTVVSGDLRFAFPGFPLKGSGAVDYDVTEKAFRNAVADISADYQCLVIHLQWRVYALLATDGTLSRSLNSQIRLGVSLGNLGAVSDFFSARPR